MYQFEIRIVILFYFQNQIKHVIKVLYYVRSHLITSLILG